MVRVHVHVLIVSICLIWNGNCFNIDTKYPIVYFYNNTQLSSSRIFGNTHFGYSVILYKGTPFNQSWIQIGAPKSNDTNNNFFEPGAVFRCPIGQACRLFPLDALNRNSVTVKFGKKEYQIKKDEAWIGGSMDIDMKHDRVAVCGHRWTNNQTYSNVAANDYQYHLTGACYWSRPKENVTRDLLPITGLRSWYKDNVFFYSKGQAGSSVHFPPSLSPELLMGAPGISNWRGSVIRYQDSRTSGQAFGDFVIPEAQDNSFSYFGYALCSGYLFSRDQLVYVAGAPRSNRFQGKISVFDMRMYKGSMRMSTKDLKQGTMAGEYFGAAIAVADINGDSLDDIIVGAPRHSIQMDEGKIYIYYGHYTGNLRLPNDMATIDGKAINGQFGTAIQSLGDLNSDGFADIAVGAPYENENHGVVYIYNGQNKGSPLKFSQKIEGKNIHPLIKGFGISISRAADIDGNHVDDVAIGSYLSENAVLLRSRPVVTLNIKRKKRNLNIETKSEKFEIEICSLYTGNYVPQELNVTRIIKMDENNRRVYLHGDIYKNIERSVSITLKRAQEKCENITFHLNPTTNYVDPIVIIVSQDIREVAGPSEPILINQFRRAKDKFCASCPVVNNATSVREMPIIIPYALNCGSDNKCDSDLMVNGEFQHLGAQNKFIIGSQAHVSLKINVTNKKEDAYLTQLDVKLPENVHLQEVPTNCNEDVQNFTLIICDVDNPLKTNKSKIIILNFDMSYITNSSKQQLAFELKAKSRSNELYESDNFKISYLHLDTNASIEIKGNAEQDVYYYQNKTKLLNATHLYKVQKSGVSPLNYFNLNIRIPVMLKVADKEPQKFLKIYQPIGVQGDQPFSCTWDDYYEYNAAEEKMESAEDTGPVVPASQRNKRSVPTTEHNKNTTNKTFIVPINNKVAFLNCSTPNIICKNLICEIGPFQRALKIASLQIKMVLNMAILQEYILKKNKKSIIYLSTDGNVTEITGHRHADFRVSNVFLQEPVAQKIALWIIIVSIIAGILILLLIILGLVKAGFFKRKAKEELEALKQQEVEKDFEIIKECENEEIMDN